MARHIISQEPLLRIDYLEFRNEATLQPIFEAAGDTLFALAVIVGTTRLIDNTVLGENM